MIDIFGTLGPACDSEDTLYAMLCAGMTGVRLNLSHEMLSEAEGSLNRLHAAADRAGRAPKLLIDLQGPELRVGVLPQPLPLAEGKRVRLGEDIPLPPAVAAQLVPDQTLLLDDGKLLLRVEEGLTARVERGGVLSSRKSVALPGLELRLPALTDDDRENLALAAALGVTGVMQPFVRSREDLISVRQALRDAGGEQIRIYAKIENQQGMAALPSLLDAADEIVIARGDLGNAMPLYALPAAQKTISGVCREAGTPFMVVTQMLASMERSPVPTRAEVSDIFNAVLDGAASVMVTGETAIGAHPVEAIRWLAQTAAEAEKFRNI